MNDCPECGKGVMEERHSWRIFQTGLYRKCSSCGLTECEIVDGMVYGISTPEGSRDAIWRTICPKGCLMIFGESEIEI
jgi:ribosomal protein S27AE